MVECGGKVYKKSVTDAAVLSVLDRVRGSTPGGSVPDRAHQTRRALSRMCLAKSPTSNRPVL